MTSPSRFPIWIRRALSLLSARGPAASRTSQMTPATSRASTAIVTIQPPDDIPQPIPDLDPAGAVPVVGPRPGRLPDQPDDPGHQQGEHRNRDNPAAR